MPDPASLRPLREDEYGSWLERTKRGYAADMVRAGFEPAAAAAKADRDHADLLGRGLASPGQLLFAIEADGAVVGSLWLAERDLDDGRRSLFVYALEIDPSRRGRGLGRAAMQLAEGVARERGLASVTLNVFGGNDVARGLYRSLGYEEQAVFMRKAL